MPPAQARLRAASRYGALDDPESPARARRPDDAPASARLPIATPRRPPLRHGRNRVAPRRGRRAPLHLRRLPSAQPAPGPRARGAGGAPGPACGHPGLERLPASGALLRRVRRRFRDPYRQPQAARRPGGLPAQPRGRPVRVLRRGLSAAPRIGGGAMPRRAGLCRPLQPGIHAFVRRPAGAAVLRGPAGGPARKLRLARTERGIGLRTVLHVRHHGPAQGGGADPQQPDRPGHDQPVHHGRRHQQRRRVHRGAAVPHRRRRRKREHRSDARPADGHLPARCVRPRCVARRAGRREGHRDLSGTRAVAGGLC